MKGIYKIVNPKGAIYIGQTINYKKRMSYYKNMYGVAQRKLFNSFLKYGFENHSFEFIEECEVENLNKRERYWQVFYNCICPKKGLNCMLVETNEQPRVMSLEVRLKLSKAKKGKTLSDSTKKRIIESNFKTKNAPGYVRPATSELTRKRNSEAAKKCPAMLNNLKLGQNKGYPIIQMDLSGNFIKEWKNAAEASKHLKVDRASISRCLSGKFKTCKNSTWKPKYVENINNKKLNFCLNENVASA